MSKVVNRKEIRKWFDMELEIIDISQIPKKTIIVW